MIALWKFLASPLFKSLEWITRNIGQRRAARARRKREENNEE